ncbi:MAG: 23S rRNA (cytosine(1962)-C(5))-methyltransferase RlmI [Anaerolineales bacterium]|nr:MAG: 23S rRNA (cytosine(1962)-C(5))-methyltransferase RlmI [Anaerolineales bacterium]
MAEIILKAGREKSLLRHHPWIFSGAISMVNGKPNPGESVKLLSAKGEFLAIAAYNPLSQIACRVWTWNMDEEITPDFFKQRLAQAIHLRELNSELIHSNAMRLVHGESDGIPGLVLDKYGETLVVQFLTAGAEFWRECIIKEIVHLTNCRVLYERSDVDVRQLEGLPLKTGLLYGMVKGEPVTIVENGLQFLVDVSKGHKTGFYLDQRENRLLTRQISTDRKILDCFSYTGGFTVNALAGNAKHVTTVDSSKEALEIAARNVELNSLDLRKVTFIEQDVFKYLRYLRDKGEVFDLIILDPPKFAPTASQAEKAARGYKDINLLALKMLVPGGYLLTFSCSGGVGEELFQKIIAGATLDAGINAVILKRLHQAVDHPVAINFPEGAYLKGFLIQRMN